jgi:hypothetical protein
MTLVVIRPSAMNYRVQHRTRYRYSEPVSLCQNLAH